ncbi:MAG: dTDP-4-dehydrorhamnose reductase [Dehalococcoidia bacterium]|nr:dTDP-4-dehydrorhamnose reductase [Dehalococcoidia bacterium]
MRVLVTGAAGMLARDLVPCLQQRGHYVLAPPENDLDITHLDAIRRWTESANPEIIINCAAYTKVDQAEKEEALANVINGLAVQNLCLACQEGDIPLVHFSTDYVFDGTKAGPYTIHDHPNPINAYGRTKLLGEKYVLWLLNRFYLVRTSWLFGIHGPNFIETMLKLAGKQKQVSVVNDQRGCPTWTQHLSEAVVSLVESGRYGVYHATNSGPTTWFEYATEIFRLAGTGTEVLPITTDQFPTAATRPKNSVLDPFPLTEVIGREMPPWQEAVRQYLEERGRAPEP